MKLRIFQSDMGDCLVLEGMPKNGQPGKLMLCDGGMASSMKNFVRERLAALRDEGRAIDLAYVSHIDNDHISGMLQLLEDEVEWRVFDHHKNNGDPIDEPEVPRPPKIKGILHNSFRRQISKNRGSIEGLATADAIENLLNSMAPSLFASAVPELVHAAEEMSAIALGIPEAIKVSELIAEDALDIPLNKPPGVAEPQFLLYAGRPGDVFKLGSMKFTLLGPTEAELEKLRDGWVNWLHDNQESVKELRRELKRRIDDFTAATSDESPFDLRSWNGIPDHKGVTAPNIASLMFMVEEKQNGDVKRLLLTGDGQQDFILDGLRRTGFLDNAGLHIDALKVQHHGSENNMDEDFARNVSADHYVFCGNGSHGNPNLDVIDIVYDSRLGKSQLRSLAAPANRDFHFWFSTTAEAQTKNTEKRKHFQKLEKKVDKLVTKSGGSLKAHFNDDAFIDLKI